MIYATWKLNFADPDYGTGPEDAIRLQGIDAEAGLSIGAVEEGGSILGYLSDVPDTLSLGAWSVEIIDETEALAFGKAVHESAYVQESGRIGLVIQR